MFGMYDHNVVAPASYHFKLSLMTSCTMNIFRISATLSLMQSADWLINHQSLHSFATLYLLQVVTIESRDFAFSSYGVPVRTAFIHSFHPGRNKKLSEFQRDNNFALGYHRNIWHTILAYPIPHPTVQRKKCKVYRVGIRICWF